ncbi:MAG: hypothetical protein KGO92_02480 [Bacteroidota bacterium]|nr:hypothetical protein [Bacteroidota bacterium]
MKRQLPILASLLFLLSLVLPSVGQGRSAVTLSSGLSALIKGANQDHAQLQAANTQLMEDADIDSDDDSDSDHSRDFHSSLSDQAHTSAEALSDADALYLKSVSHHLFTPALFLSNRTLRL